MEMTKDEAKAKVEQLQKKYGTNYPLHELFVLDHRAVRYNRVFDHGAIEGMIGYCSLCREEWQKDQVIEDRKQLLMNDLLGETVFVRSRGYKTMRKATIEVHDHQGRGAGAEVTHYLIFNYHGEDRGQDLRRIMRLDVLLDGERLEVWNDGEEDLNPWERGKHSNSSRPCDKTYDEYVGSIH